MFWWRAALDESPESVQRMLETPTSGDAAVIRASREPHEGGTPVMAGHAEDFESVLTPGLLAGQHDRPPRGDEWPELLRIVLEAPDGDLAEAAEARFAIHAGSHELAILAEAYDETADEDSRQRVIEIFSSLQSAASMEAARRILDHPDDPIDDHLVIACAEALARRGDAADMMAIFKRLNEAGEDPDPMGSMYSVADGLTGAISSAEADGLESLLMDAAAGRGAAFTGRSRAAAAVALRNFHTVQVTELLYQLSRNEPHPQVRQCAAESLRSIQTPE